ncbi:SEC-C domain-containing protein [Anaerobacillus alkaliphilus]|uniref:SEC-C domain-containing protein n=1 Tax=Anaerobacillus alkaliphilus TaxID=1548597 RepID=A0A4Q0VTF8_9BACI|nr:SEC-C domain-containing protein [Anaerobacillus alkaliphilus]RXJ00313.1 SEC-C domain-containing protein [Anaerobacillus alkaliphilus]
MTKRNEPCPCGSSKKYKNCCASKVPTDIDKLIEFNILELQQDIFHYAQSHYEDGLEECINEFFEEAIFEDEDQFDHAGFLLMTWAIFSLPIAETKQTILESYIKKHSKKITRPALREALEKLPGTAPSVFKVKRDDQMVLFVEDIFTEEEKQIQLLVPNNDEKIGEDLDGYYVLGMTMSCHNRTYFFGTFQVITSAVQIGEILSLYEIHSDELSPQQFTDEFFPEIIEVAFNGLPDFNDMPWDNPNQKQVSELVRANLKVAKEIKPTLEGLTITLWKVYCSKTGGNIRNIPKYAAALHFIIGHFMVAFGEDELSKQQLAKMYDVKIRGLSDTINKLEDVLEDDLNKIADDLIFGLVEDEDYDPFDFEDEDDDDIDLDDFFLEEEFIIDELAKKRNEKQKVRK